MSQAQRARIQSSILFSTFQKRFHRLLTPTQSDTIIEQRGVFGASVYASGPEIVSSKTIDGERGIPNVSEKTVPPEIHQTNCPHRVFPGNQSIDLSSLNCLIWAIAE